MKTTIQETAILIAIVAVIAIAFCIGIRKEIHRQDVACQTMQKNGYEVDCP